MYLLSCMLSRHVCFVTIWSDIFLPQFDLPDKPKVCKCNRPPIHHRAICPFSLLSHFLSVSYFQIWTILYCFSLARGPETSVIIATGYGLDGPGKESRWEGEISHTCPDRPWVHPASCTMGTGSFQGGKSGGGVTLTPHPLLVPFVMKE